MVSYSLSLLLCVHKICTQFVFAKQNIHILTQFHTKLQHTATAHAGNEVLEYSLAKCKLLAEKVNSVNELPYECKKYPDAMKEASKPAKISRKDTDAYAGMQGATAAKAVKKSGRESHAQIQRRLTNTRRFTKQK